MMRKLLFLLTAFFLLGGVRMSAVTLQVDLSKIAATSENTTWSWNASEEGNPYGVFTWSQTFYNGTDLPGTGGNFAIYDEIKFSTEQIEEDGPTQFRLIVDYSNGSSRTTAFIGVDKDVVKTWADLGVDEKNLPYISKIRLSGDNVKTGSIKVNSIEFKGPDIEYVHAVRVYTIPAGTTDLKDLNGDNEWTGWSSTIKYPAVFDFNGGAFYGDGDGSSESTHVNISDYDYLCFMVDELGAAEGASIRVFIWVPEEGNNPGKVVTLYLYPIEELETAVWTNSHKTTKTGLYVVDVRQYSHLKGIKALYDGGSVTIGHAWAIPKGSTDFTLPKYGYTLKGEVKNDDVDPTAAAALADKKVLDIDATGLTGTGYNLTSANPNCIFKANSGVLTNGNNVMVGSTIAKLSLTDGYDFAVPAVAEAKVTAATYTRSTVANKFGTVCLPYEVTIPVDGSVKFYGIKGINTENALVLEEKSGTLPAGTPAIVYSGNDVTSISLSNSDEYLDVSSNTAVDKLTLVGSYEAKSIDAASDASKYYYGISNNQFVRATKTLNVKPFRAYITADNPSSGEANVLRLLIGDDDVTGNMEPSQAAPTVEAIYNLQGVRLSTMQKGMNILQMSNGQSVKVLVK